MFQKVLLVAIVTLSLMAFGQSGSRTSGSTANVSNHPAGQPFRPMQISTEVPTAPTGGPGVVQPVVVGNGLGWNSGTVGYYGEGPAGGVLLSTPSATFDSPLPTAGISIAGRAGISDSNPVNTEVQSTLGSPTLVYTNIQPEQPAGVSPATEAVSPTTQTMDYGPSYFSNEAGGGAVSGVSLAEIAERYRNAQGTQMVKTYTNRDVRPAGNVVDAENVLLARNTPSALPQAAPSANRREEASANPPSTVTQNTGATEQSPQSDNQNRSLPASATILPLLGLLGMMSGGLGLWIRSAGSFSFASSLQGQARVPSAAQAHLKDRLRSSGQRKTF